METEQIIIENVQAEMREEAVPALLDAVKSLVHTFGSEHRVRLADFNVEYSGNPGYEMGRVSWGRPGCWWEQQHTFTFSKIKGIAKWGYNGHVPTAEDLENVMERMIIIAEHYAVGQWKQKGPGTISRLKRLHTLLEEPVKVCCSTFHLQIRRLADALGGFLCYNTARIVSFARGNGTIVAEADNGSYQIRNVPGPRGLCHRVPARRAAPGAGAGSA